MFKRLKCKYHDINIQKMKDLKEQWDYEEYTKNRLSKDNASYWYPIVKKAGFTVPNTRVYQLSYEQYKWLKYKTDEKDEQMHLFTKDIELFIKEHNLNTYEELYIKPSGSNALVFNIITNTNNIGLEFYKVYKYSDLFNYIKSTEIVVSEYITSCKKRPKLLDYLILDTRFIVEVDFDNKKVESISNFWDKNIDTLKLNEYDYLKYLSVQEVIECEYTKHKSILINTVEEKVRQINELSSICTLEFILKEDEYYLVSMYKS